MDYVTTSFGRKIAGNQPFAGLYAGFAFIGKTAVMAMPGFGLSLPR
jgi:hypothetical protein